MPSSRRALFAGVLFLGSAAYAETFEVLIRRAVQDVQATDNERRLTHEFRAAWDALDDLVLKELSAGHAIGEIESHLEKLAFGGPFMPVQYRRVRGSLVEKKGFEPPSYYVTSGRTNDGEFLLGVYDWGTPEPGCGRISVFSRVNARWLKTDQFDTEFGGGLLEVYRLPSPPGIFAMIAIQQFLAADRFEGTLRAFRLENGRLIREGETWRRLVDFGVEHEPTRVAVQFARFPKSLRADLTGPRLHYELRLAQAPKGLQTELESLTPWLEALEQFEADLQAERFNQCRAMLANPGLLSILSKEMDTTLRKESGDITRGRAIAIFDGETGLLHVELRRKPNGRWQITSAQLMCNHTDRSNPCPEIE